MAGRIGSRAGEIRDVTQRRVQIFADAGDAWPFAKSLKSISEDTAQEYEGRAVLELIQNGHDAIRSGASGRIHVLLDLDGEHALYVANDGVPFNSANFLAIIGFGLSDKAAGEGIGNKGLGFRSVLLLTDRPEIYSRDPDDPADRAFSGYSFRFPTSDEMAGLAADEELGKRLAADVSPFDLPVPASVEDPEVLKFAASGFATVIKLPLRDNSAAVEARRQVDGLSSAEAPILLFLSRIARLELTIRSAGQDAGSPPLARSENPAALRPDLDWVKEVDLGSQGAYLLARRLASPENLKDAIRRSVASRQVDARWLDWDGDAWIGVALPLGGRRTPGAIYTFLPMEQPSPLAAHIHAPFFTKLARRELGLDVPLNDYLMGEVAATCLQLLRVLRDADDHEAAAPLVVDLGAWAPPHHEYLSRACVEAGSTLNTEQFIPVAGSIGWSSLRDAYAWPPRLESLTVVTAQALAALGHPVADPGIGPDRQKRVTELHRAVNGTGMEPRAEALAAWVESLAKSMCSPGSTGLDTWAQFYDDLAVAFSGNGTALHGRAIILDQESRLQHAMGSERDDRQVRQLFFSPSADDGEGGPAVVKLPRPLAARVAYTHPDIPWNITEPTRRRRPGRTFLESNGLVREYRTDQLLAVIRDLLARRPSTGVQGAALQFACSLHAGLNETQRAALAAIPFTVPTAGGEWRPAPDTAFSRLWGTDGGLLLDRLLSFATEASPGLQSLKECMISSPSDWPAPLRDRGQWVNFLRAIGVHDGLPVQQVAFDGGQGNHLRAQYLVGRLGLPPSLAEAWELDVAERWHDGNHPYTQYKFSAAITSLPGAGEVEDLGDEARETYARLLARGLTVWPTDVFEVRVWRPERRGDLQDVHRWPTPVSSYLRHAQWLPLEVSDDDDTVRAFARPADAWLSVSGQLPRFVPPILPAVRNALTSTSALNRLKAAGIQIWDEPEYCRNVLRQLPDLLANGLVAAHDAASFKKQCRLAWDHLINHPERWPWQDDEAPVVVAAEQSQIRALTLEEGTSILIPDEADQAKQAMFGLTAKPVLVAEAERGAAIAKLMKVHGLDALPTSEVSVEVFADDQLIIPNPELPELVTDDRQWLATIVALAAELKADPFARHTEQSIRQIVERLRKIRLVRAQSVRIVVGSDEIEPPGQTTSLPIDDGVAPTVVTWGSQGTMFDELERCAESISFLIGQPRLAAELQLAFTRLGRSFPAAPATDISDQELALALQVSESQVRESRDDLRGPLFDVLDRVRVVLLYFGGAESLKDFDALLRNASDEQAIVAALEGWHDILPVSPPDLLIYSRAQTGFADLRDALNLDFRRFNDVLENVDPPHPPLRHPERHQRAMARFTEAHQVAILDRLREAYLPVALSQGDLTPYGEARNLDGIEADPAWLELYADLPEELVADQVGKWLAGHSASTELDRETDLADLVELRSRNFEMLENVVQDADPRVRAWSRQHGVVLPAGWSAPMSGARSVLEQSYLADFFELSAIQILDVVADALGWPDQMNRTLDLAALGLDEADLLSRDQEAVEDRRLHQHERTHLLVDGRELPVTSEYLSALADTVAATLTEDFLAQSGKATLAQVPSRPASRSGSQGRSGLAIARMPGMSDEQRIGVGLIGEVAARAWLERHYTSVEWVSGYRNIVLGDTAGSDSHGYDLVARRASGKPLYFEVKALAGQAVETVEFELGETEVVAAQRHRDAYHILLVSAALDSSSRQILELPNPLGARGTGRYTLVGRGLRYRCALQRE